MLIKSCSVYVNFIFFIIFLSPRSFGVENIEHLETINVSTENESNTSNHSLGFQVEKIDTEEYKNSSADINKVINNSPGVIIRENGGLGSKFKLSINGFSDKQIRYFVDGMPMENFGSSLSLNNFPINLIDSIEIYKGVTPIELSSDSLGGAINITTPDPTETLVDLSYSYGSFNTHRVSALAQTSFQDTYYVRISSFANYSDNDYSMNNVPKKDKFGNKIGTKRAKRFHDGYTSSMLNIKAGVFDTEYADDLSVSLTYAQNRNDEQHPDKSINKVFGGFNSENKTFLGSLSYKKNFDKLKIKAYLLKGKISEITNDLLSRSYDWDGSYVDKFDPNAGELGSRSKFTREDSILNANIFSSYQITDQSIFEVGLSSNLLDRSGNDEINKNNTSFTRPNFVNKHILAGAYRFNMDNNKFNTSLFIKKYFYNAQINAHEFIDFNPVGNIKTDVDLSKTGYGFTAKYNINKKMSIKTSYENTYRFPEPDEILGSGKYILPNRNLKPENSHNFNLGIDHKLTVTDFKFTNNINLFFRDAEDFIQFVPTQLIFGRYENLNKLKVQGIELSSLVLFKNYSLQVNATWQDMTDQTKFNPNGTKNNHYEDKIPNEPYLFANLRLGTHFNFINQGSVSVYWSTRYTHEYFLQWESSGNQSDKFIIPTQLTHDMGMTYFPNEASYSVSLDVINIFDEEVYDNYNIQKPGRAIYVKIGYLF